jgi:methionine synthase II (cobalamin-independent)
VVRTTVVGSWWLHPEYERDLLEYHDGKLSLDEAEGVLERAAARAIKEQRDLGLDDGQVVNTARVILSASCTAA